MRITSITLLLTLGLSHPIWSEEPENLLGTSDFNHATGIGTIEGYKTIAKVPGDSEEHAADSFVTPLPDGEAGTQLTLPEGKDLWISSLQPLHLNTDDCYLFSVDLKWSEMQPTGPGIPMHGPGIFIYVYSVPGEHFIAQIEPSADALDWITLQIPFDTGKNPAFESIRILLVSKDILGTVQLRNARLIQVEREELPESRQFLLPDGSKLIGHKLAL